MDTRYNGWRNYDTWLAKLWMDNDGTDLAEMAEECLRNALEDNPADADSARSEAAATLADALRSQFEEAADALEVTGFFADVINAAIREVDWHEIADGCVDDVPLWSAGWNMPGYMPDSDPALFMDWSDARDYIAGEIRTTAEQDEEDPEATQRVDDLREYADSLDNLKPDYDAEIGNTVGQYHYWVAKV
jgi:hypothetical protein